MWNDHPSFSPQLPEGTDMPGGRGCCCKRWKKEKQTMELSKLDIRNQAQAMSGLRLELGFRVPGLGPHLMVATPVSKTFPLVHRQQVSENPGS